MEKVRSLLHCAVMEQQIEIVSNLIIQGMDVDAVDFNEKTPLYYAIQSRNVPIIKLLLDAGTNVTKTDLIRHVIESQNVDLLKLFLSKIESVNDKDLNGNGLSPLRYAVQWGNSKVVKLLLDSDAWVHAYPQEKTVLHESVKTGSVDIVKLLLAAGADINVDDDSGDTPLHMAIDSENVNILKLLIDSGANVNAKNEDSDTPLHTAIEKQKVKAIKLLLDAGSDVHAQNMHKATPLHLAANYCSDDVFRLLLETGADINALDEDHDTPLHWAVRSTKKNIDLSLLLNVGANLNLKNYDDETPLMTLISGFKDTKYYRDLVELFLEFSDVNFDNAFALKTILESTDFAKKRKVFYKIILKHISKLKALDYQVDQSLINIISHTDDYNNYYQTCFQELEQAKSTKLHNSWITFFNLLVDDKSKFVKYAGNKDLVKDSKNSVKKFPIYGAAMKGNMTKGVDGRKSFDGAANILSYCLPILNPTHLIIRDILDVLNVEDWKELCENKRNHE